jgi:membrane protease YdiL (CAAX protease family)
LPMGLVTGLLIWQAVKPQAWKFSPSTLMGMGLESLLLAVALVGLSKVLDMGFTALERSGPPVLASGPDPGAGPGAPAIALVGFLGAGLYEETLFRLLLIPLFFKILRVLQTPQVLASSAAVTASALLFSLAHHAGTPGEAFTWFAFIFRWLAGVYFAWIFVVRGFGVAVGTHTAYDVLVGWIGWHL